MAETRDFMLETEREMIFVNEAAPPRDFMLDGMVFHNSTAEAAVGGGGAKPRTLSLTGVG